MYSKLSFGIVISMLLVSSSLLVSLLIPGCNNASNFQGDNKADNTAAAPPKEEVTVQPRVEYTPPLTGGQVQPPDPPQPGKIDESVDLSLEEMERTSYVISKKPILNEKSPSQINALDISALQAPPPGYYMHEQFEEQHDFNTQEYDKIRDNAFKTALQNPLSTFSIDVDNAAYSNVRRFLNNGELPYASAVRVEEMINYFAYDYPQPDGEHVFSVTTEVGDCPWNKQARLARIGIKGKELDKRAAVASNLTFLVDVSGSMQSPNKLPLVKQSLKLLLNELGANDRVAIVVYAGAAGQVLPSTPASQKEKILQALDGLEAGGSTAGAAGIQLAYNIAKENFVAGGNNRVILATDGDFNVGVSSTGELVTMIEEKRKQGIFLTICSFGMDNLKDSRMEQISDAGNGNYYYIDNIMEANKVFVENLTGTLFTIAKDVKIQVEFNPELVKAYRLVGYENRMLQNEDFNDDKKDAGELGAGHTVTALYEIIPAGSDFVVQTTDSLKYQKVTVPRGKHKQELMTVKVRYKLPNADVSKLLSVTVRDESTPIDKCSDDFRFAASVASFGMLLRDSEHKGNATYARVLELAQSGKGADKFGYREEFITLVKKASMMGL